jgi:hypothetical protein
MSKPHPRPEVFISATNSDLGSCRQIVKEALLTRGCVPVEQSSLPTGPFAAREMLRARMESCLAVVHIASEIFGPEPMERSEERARQSYAQLEFDIARETGKQVYVFVCTEGF